MTFIFNKIVNSQLYKQFVNLRLNFEDDLYVINDFNFEIDEIKNLMIF